MFKLVYNVVRVLFEEPIPREKKKLKLTKFGSIESTNHVRQLGQLGQENNIFIYSF